MMGNDVNKRIIALSLATIIMFGVYGYHNKMNPELSRTNLTSQLRLKEAVTIFETSSGNVSGCEVLILYDWLVVPEECEDDWIRLNWNEEYFTLSSFKAYSTVKNISTGETKYFDFITSPHAVQNGGIGWYTKLRDPDISSKIQSNPAGYAIAYFEPSCPLRNNDNLVKDFDVIYVHDKCPGKTSIDVSDVIYFKMEEDKL